MTMLLELPLCVQTSCDGSRQSSMHANLLVLFWP